MGSARLFQKMGEECLEANLVIEVEGLRNLFLRPVSVLNTTAEKNEFQVKH